MADATDRGFWALKTGAVVERYRIEKVLGHGGFGITYLVHHTELGKMFALKEHFPRMFSYRDTATTHVKASDEGNFNWTLDQFIAEGRSLAKCHHPNVTLVADVFRANGTAYMVLGYENGSSLKNWLMGLGRVPTQGEMDRIVFPLLDALKVVHEQGLMHRDIAADNIIIREDGSPCLIDFGAARQSVAERSMMMTAIIKSGYSPPEQYSSAGKGQGPWSDIYALGATLYFAVSGKMPPESTDRQMGEELVPVEDAVADRSAYRPEFLKAINKCLNLKIVDRYQDVGSLLADMRIHGASVDREAPTVLAGTGYRAPSKQSLAIAETEVASPRELRQRQDAYSPSTVLIPGTSKSAEEYIAEGDEWKKADNYARAIDEYDKAISSDPSNSDYYFKRGLCYALLNEPSLAITDFGKAIVLNPSHWNAYYNRGLAHRQLKNLEKARLDFSRAIELEPQAATAYHERGRLLEEIGDIEGALKDYQFFSKIALADPKDTSRKILAMREQSKSKNDESEPKIIYKPAAIRNSNNWPAVLLLMLAIFLSPIVAIWIGILWDSGLVFVVTMTVLLFVSGVGIPVLMSYNRKTEKQ